MTSTGNRRHRTEPDRCDRRSPPSAAMGSTEPRGYRPEDGAAADTAGGAP